VELWVLGVNEVLELGLSVLELWSDTVPQRNCEEMGKADFRALRFLWFGVSLHFLFLKYSLVFIGG
jgi:hypothetical protein